MPIDETDELTRWRPRARRRAARAAAASLLTAWFFLAAPAVGAIAAEAVGEAAAVKGRVIVIRGNDDIADPLVDDAPLYAEDIVRTFERGAAKLKFTDDTVVTLGESTTVEISEYLYDEARGERSVLLTIAEGITARRSRGSCRTPDSRSKRWPPWPRRGARTGWGRRR